MEQFNMVLLEKPICGIDKHPLFLDLGFCRDLISMDIEACEKKYNALIFPEDIKKAKYILRLHDNHRHNHSIPAPERLLGDFVMVYSWCFKYIDVWSVESLICRFRKLNKFLPFENSDGLDELFHLVYPVVKKRYGFK